MSAPQANPWIASIAPYVAGRHGGDAKVIKLSSNEAALGASPAAIEAHKAAVSLERYPDSGHHELREAIAEVHGIDAGRILCGAGSDEVLQLIGQAYARPGTEIVFPDHSFAMYPIIAQKTGATPVVVPDPNYTLDVDALLAAVNERTVLMFIANPNNPTGTYVKGAEIRRLADNLPQHVLLVIDAAYAEFVEDDDHELGFGMVDSRENVVVTRTFSKIYGLAAVRCGWGYFPAAVFENVAKLRSPFNITSGAIAAAIEAVKDQDHVAKARAFNNDWLGRLTQSYRGMGLEVVPSRANFLLIGFPNPARPAAAADKFLTANNILVRYLPGQGLPNHLRITIGTEDENRAVLDALEAFLKG